MARKARRYVASIPHGKLTLYWADPAKSKLAWTTDLREARYMTAGQCSKVPLGPVHVTFHAMHYAK